MSADSSPTPALLSGYSAFTTFRWPLPQRLLERHWRRLSAHARAMAIAPPEASTQALRERIVAALAQTPRLANDTDWTVRLTLAPQVERLESLWRKDVLSADLRIDPRPAPPLADDRSPGLSLQAADYRKAFPLLKHGALAEALMLRRQARSHGFDDALWRDGAGRFTEATTANVFWIRPNALLTPHPERDGCLAGIARAEILELAQAQGLSCHETALNAEALDAVEGGFLSNAVSGLTPIAALDGVPLRWSDSARRLLKTLQASYNARQRDESSERS